MIAGARPYDTTRAETNTKAGSRTAAKHPSAGRPASSGRPAAHSKRATVASAFFLQASGSGPAATGALVIAPARAADEDAAQWDLDLCRHLMWNLVRARWFSSINRRARVLPQHCQPLVQSSRASRSSKTCQPAIREPASRERRPPTASPAATQFVQPAPPSPLSACPTSCTRRCASSRPT